MLKRFLKSKTNKEQHTDSAAPETTAVNLVPTEPPKKPSLFGRLVAGLSKTRQGITTNISNLFLGKKQIDQELLDEIETLLLTADIGASACQHKPDRPTIDLVRSPGRPQPKNWPSCPSPTRR